MGRRQLRRRRLIAATVGVVATTGGCTSIIDGVRSTPGRIESFERSTDYMMPGNWWVERFELDGPGWLTYEFVAGSEVDLYLLVGDSYEQYAEQAGSDHPADREDFEYHREGSLRDGETGEVDVDLDPGDYALVLDNTRVGPAESDRFPDDDQVITVSIDRWEGEVYERDG